MRELQSHKLNLYKRARFANAFRWRLREHGVEAQPLTEHYLVQLLATYANQPIDDTPLALKMLGAQGAAPREKRERLREVGDTSLFLSGFWAESFARKLVDCEDLHMLKQNVGIALALARYVIGDHDDVDEIAR